MSKRLMTLKCSIFVKVQIKTQLGLTCEKTQTQFFLHFNQYFFQIFVTLFASQKYKMQSVKSAEYVSVSGRAWHICVNRATFLPAQSPHILAGRGAWPSNPNTRVWRYLALNYLISSNGHDTQTQCVQTMFVRHFISFYLFGNLVET